MIKTGRRNGRTAAQLKQQLPSHHLLVPLLTAPTPYPGEPSLIASPSSFLSLSNTGNRRLRLFSAALPFQHPSPRHISFNNHHHPPSSHKMAPPSAFAEATGGAMGALWTTLLFHPLDVAKLRLQAEADAEEEEEGEEGVGGEKGKGEEQQEEGKTDEHLPVVMEQGTSTNAGSSSSSASTSGATKKGPKTFFGEALVVLKQPDLWYAGLGLKLQLSVLSTFVYFYVYTSLKRGFARLFKRPVTFLPNLLLASLAGVVNILITMPLDTVVTRLQVAPRGQRPSFQEMVRILWEEQQQQQQQQQPASQKQALLQTLRRLSRFWHGLLPALLLTSNPAINYAAYDAMKALIPLPPTRKHHNVKETFLIGMLSKFLATILTYPLIRAKVMMMSDTKRARFLQPHLKDRKGREDDEEPEVSLMTLSPSLMLAQERQGLGSILRMLVKEGGVRELYVGLDGQIINTALKNATLLNTKDRISRVTSYILRQVFSSSS